MGLSVLALSPREPRELNWLERWGVELARANLPTTVGRLLGVMVLGLLVYAAVGAVLPKHR